MNDKMVLELSRTEAKTLCSVIQGRIAEGVYSEFTRIELNNIKDKLMKYLQS